MMIKKSLAIIIMLMIVPIFGTVTVQAWDCDLIASQEYSYMGMGFVGLDDFFGAQEIGQDIASKISYIEGFEIRMQTLTSGDINGYIGLSETLTTEKSEWFWKKTINSDYDKGTQLGDSPQWLGFEVDQYVDLDNLYIIYEVESANDKFCWWFGNNNPWIGGDSYVYYDDSQYLGWHKKTTEDYTFKIYGKEKGLPNHYAVFIGSDWAFDASISKLKSVIDNGFWTDIKTVEGFLSKNDVLNAIDWLYDKSLSNKECTLLFYFCGHSGRNYVQLNGENMLDVEFQSAFSKFDTSDKLILIFETCFSGRMDDDTEIDEKGLAFMLLKRIKERLLEITEYSKVTDALNKVIEKITENIQKRIENTDPAKDEEIFDSIETVEPEDVTPIPTLEPTPEPEQTPVEPDVSSVTIDCIEQHPDKENDYTATIRCSELNGGQYKIDKNSDGSTDPESSNSGIVTTTDLDSPEENYDGFFGNLVKSGRIVIASCKAGQSAWVHSNGYTAAFTYFLAEALRSTTYIENAFDEAKRDTQPHVFFQHGKLQNPQISDKIPGNVQIKI